MTNTDDEKRDDGFQYIVFTIDPAAEHLRDYDELIPDKRAHVDRFARVHVQMGPAPDRLTEGGLMMLTVPAANAVIHAFFHVGMYAEEIADDYPELGRMRMTVQGSHPLVREFNSQLTGKTPSTH